MICKNNGLAKWPWEIATEKRYVSHARTTCVCFPLWVREKQHCYSDEHVEERDDSEEDGDDDDERHRKTIRTLVPGTRKLLQY